MANPQPPRSPKSARKRTSPLAVRLDAESMACITRAAALRRISVSEYVRIVALTQARREVDAASELTIRLSSEEQIAF